MRFYTWLNGTPGTMQAEYFLPGDSKDFILDMASQARATRRRV
ncbi:MAG TPA: hypothetical protein VGN95_18455 [Pyrinomonadaceae bacterium]|nr:hypothetical protein [Pyrinomonadaceae bacterium]